MALNNTTMKAKDAVFGSLASCFVTINGRRYNFMMLSKFESKYAVSATEVAILGQTNMGHKSTGGKGTWTGTAHYNQSYLRVIADTYQKTGVMPYFEIQVTNEDPTSAAGRQTIVHHDCLSDTFILASFEAGEKILDEDLSGTFDTWDIPEKFTDLPGV